MGLMLSGPALASASHRAYFLRDALHEEYLKTQADPDKKITPARVLRWLKGFSGESLVQTPASNTEFQPTVDTHNGHYKVIAALTFKFY